MKNKAFFAIFLALSVPLAAQGVREFKGVKSEEKISYGGTELVLNGMGLRKKVIFNVYVASLYLEKASADGNAIAGSAQVKIMDLVFLRAVGGETIAEAIENGFKNNARDMKALAERLKALKTLIPDLKKGDRVRFVSGKNGDLEMLFNGGKKGEIKGKDFSETLFRVWLGDKPADENLKKGLLGKA